MNNEDHALLLRALAALEYHREQTRPIQQTNDTIDAIRARLTAAQPQRFVGGRIAYRGFSYGVGSQDGIDSLRRAINERGEC